MPSTGHPAVPIGSLKLWWEYLREKSRDNPNYLFEAGSDHRKYFFFFLPGSFSRKGSLAYERWGGQSPAIPESPDGMGDGWWKGLDGRF